MDVVSARAALRVAGVVAIATAVVASSTPAHADPAAVTRYTAQVANLEDAVVRLAREFSTPLALIRSFPFQSRLLDARVFYELGNYETAAIVLIDVIEDPAFAGNLEFEAAQLLLGEALLEIGNVKAAEEAFSRVTRGRDRALAEQARFYLIELALSAGNEVPLRALVEQMGGQATSDRTRYGLGKAHLRLGEPDKAILWLQVIGPDSAVYLQARYYLGVAYTSLRQYGQALSVFQGLTAAPSEDPEEMSRRDLAWLAVGRLQAELGDTARALTSYQNIDRNSPHYEVALYEMAWAYIKQEQYDKALLTVDILLLTVQDEQVDVDAHVLRGRLNVMMNDYDEAMDSYTSIINRFAPVRNELARFTRDGGEVQRYFQWLLERQAGIERLSAPLTERTSKWVETTRDIGRVAAVFDRIAGERQDIVEARKVGQDLERLLSSRNRVELFPNLRDGWARAIVLENRLVLLSSALLDAQADAFRGRIVQADAAEHHELVTYRRSLDERARALPTSFEAYDRRQAVVSDRYRDLERKNFMVEQGLAEVKRQLLSLERYVDDKQYADEGEKLSARREEEIRSEIELEKAALQELFDELLALKEQIELEARRVGAGDAASQGDAHLKQALLDAHLREGAFYDRVAMRLGGPIATSAQQFAALRSRVTGALGRLDGVVAAIDSEVESKTNALRGEVARELGALQGYAGEVAVYDGEGRDLARDMGEELFRRAQRRMDQVVLEADVGILDVVWERKQRTSDQLQAVNTQRSERTQQLAEDLRALRDGAGEDARDRAAPVDEDEP